MSSTFLQPRGIDHIKNTRLLVWAIVVKCLVRSASGHMPRSCQTQLRPGDTILYGMQKQIT